MDNLKFTLFSILVIGLLGLGSYWAISTMETGSTHVDNQKVKDLEDKNKDLEKQVAFITRENDLLKEEKKSAPIIVETPVVEAPVKNINTTTKTTVTTTTTTYKYQSLINELQKLIDGNVYLKLKSQGASVGTVQRFLNAYNNTSTKVDNDYGATTVTAVKAFQKAQKIIADGESGSGTFTKMIAWLKTK